MTRPHHVLFLSTGNSARSVMAEALLNAWGGGRYRAFSAGSRPAGAVNPFTIETLQRHGLPTGGLRSKSWDEFAAASAPAIDLVITVCDNAAGETCPIWPGRPAKAHWSFFDPAAAQGDEQTKRAAFEAVFASIRHRIEVFCDLPAMGTPAFQRALADLSAAQP
jgi:arsenate reductase